MHFRFTSVDHVASHNVLHHHTSHSVLRSCLYHDRESLSYNLGILPNGASSLLMPVNRVRLPAKSHKQACDFISLSPIHFDDVNELEKKLEWLKPRTSGSRAKKGKDMDTSSANQGYYVTISNDRGSAMTEGGWQRAAFEHSR